MASPGFELTRHIPLQTQVQLTNQLSLDSRDPHYQYISQFLLSLLGEDVLLWDRRVCIFAPDLLYMFICDTEKNHQKSWIV